MMTENPPQPTCPKCNYDLTGITRANNAALCPECGSICVDSEKIINDRTHTITRAMLWILLVPSLHAGAWYVFYAITKNPIIAGYSTLPLAIQAIILMTIPPLMISHEWSMRKPNEFEECVPEAWKVDLSIAASWFVSGLITLAVVLRLILAVG